jgi:hypothetical protein
MLMKTSCLWACLALSALASPVSESELSRRAITPYLATFDDKLPVDLLSDVTNAPEIGSYNGLRWQGFCTSQQFVRFINKSGCAEHRYRPYLDTVQPGILGFLYLGSLVPNSGSNCAGYDTLGSLDTNTPFITRKLTVESRSTSTKPTIDMKSFW